MLRCVLTWLMTCPQPRPPLHLCDSSFLSNWADPQTAKDLSRNVIICDMNDSSTCVNHVFEKN